jgi:molybdopterin-containing oxidoreductase family iron-sulfur binding subunit
MENSRRNFLKVAGASALGVGIAGTGLKAIASAAGPAGHEADVVLNKTEENAQETLIRKPLPAKAAQWGMVIDTRKLKTDEQLERVVTACRKAHSIPVLENKRHEIKWIWGTKYHNAFPSQGGKYLSRELEHRPIPVLCNHCENPPCVKACPTKATFKRKDGAVMMDYHRCIGCRFCMAGCPYGARSFNFVDPRPAIKEEDYNPKFPTRMKGVVEKCNFCVERIARGEYPACVEASQGAILFGDLGDPKSEVREALSSHYSIRRKPALGTEPAVYYIL